MEIRSNEEDDTITRLYEASMEGSVVTLNSLIRKDPLILSKISLTTFTETPLHISALLGHLHFTKQLLALEPKLTFELDALKRSPLHLASAKGHTEIVQALLQQNQDPDIMCLAKDECGRIPLHYAAMRGHVDVIELLVSAQQRSIFEVLPDGETVLHLCVQYNHLKALKVLVKSVGYHNADFLNSKEHTGVKAAAENTLNNKELKASDMLEPFPPDFKALQIQRILTNADTGIETREKLQDCDHLKISTPEPTTKPSVIKNKLSKWWRKWVKHVKSEGTILTQETHNSLMVVATVIATITFQSAVNPPGGVWDSNHNSTKNPRFRCSESDICIAGTAVFGYADDFRDDYKTFITYNSASFLASLGVILLLISGVPMGNKFGTWILTVAMCVALTFMALTFLQGLYLVTPDDIINPVLSIDNVSFYAWGMLLGLIGLFHSVRFLCWVLIVKGLRPNKLCLLALAKRFKRQLENC